MLRAKKKTGLIFFPAFDWAISPTHPEREERLLYTQDQIIEEGLLDIPGITEYRARSATYEDIRRVHFCFPDERTVTTESHLISSGGCLVAADALMKKEVECAFALVRPPGHHATRIVYGNRGFCNVNNEAIMIEYIRDTYGVRKVAIVDTDCHHGDGTQDIYWNDPDTLFISIHQDGRTLYPGSGFPTEFGGINARGTTLNIPLPPNTGEEGFLYVLDEVVIPALERFEPELVINSAGQDNHYSDPITNMNFSAQGYATLTSRLKPDIAVLEGGYSIEDSLPYVNVGIILALAGLDYSHVKEPRYDVEYRPQSRDITTFIQRLAKELNSYFVGEEHLKHCQSDGTIIKRSRCIHYDTDMIQDEQSELIRVCRQCAGAWCINSRSSWGHKTLAVHNPRYSCPECTKIALEWFDQADKKTYQHVVLQDRANCIYAMK